MSGSSIVAVLVLYREQPAHSACFRSLHAALTQQTDLQRNFQLVLYDNSPAPQTVPDFAVPLRYISDPKNGGVAAAYNAGLLYARDQGTRWLLLLDQDTALTSEYLQELRDALPTVPENVVAVVPRLVQDGSTHSPSRLPRLSHRSLPDDVAGMLPYPVSVYNSGAAVRVAAIDRFPERYWLDFLDHAVFHGLQRHGGRIWLLHARLQHRLSSMNLGVEASTERYRNIVMAERDFYCDYGSTSDRFYYHLRRLKQTAGHLVKVKDRRFAWISAKAALGLLPQTPPRT